jgi:hypothetical protein
MILEVEIYESTSHDSQFTIHENQLVGPVE